jgi:CBS domain containing-hemolysin-like protein
VIGPEGGFDKSEIEKLDESKYKINCSAELNKVERALKISLEGSAITLNGWIIEQLSAVPEVGYEFTYDRFNFKITDSNEKQVISVIVTLNSDLK